MNTLRERLAAAVAEARFDLEYTDVRGDGTRTRRERRALSSEELASAYTSQRDRIGSMRADCHVTDDTIGSLVAEVRKELAEFICPQSGHLGHAFPIDQYRTIRNSGGENGVSHLEYESTPENFAKSLLRAAAIMGVDKTTELLAAWKQGGPVRFRKSTVVKWGSSERPICTTPGHRDCGLAVDDGRVAALTRPGSHGAVRLPRENPCVVASVSLPCTVLSKTA